MTFVMRSDGAEPMSRVGFLGHAYIPSPFDGTEDGGRS